MSSNENVQVYVNGRLADIDPRKKIAVTKRGFTVLNPRDRFVDFTNRIALKNSKNNDEIFRFARFEKHRSRIPYSYFHVRVLVGSSELIPNGVGELIGTGDEYELQVYSFAKGIFDKLATISLDEIDVGAYDVFDENLIPDGVFDNTVVVDYGKMVEIGEVPELSNPDMIFTEGVWENEAGAAVDWENVDGWFGGELVSGGSEPSTDYLLSLYSFQEPTDYRIYIKALNYNPQEMLLQVVAWNSISDNTLVSSLSISASAGVYETEMSFNPTKNYTHIALRLLRAGTDSITGKVAVQRADISIIDNDVQISLPWYVPTVNYESLITRVFQTIGESAAFDDKNKLCVAYGKDYYGYSKKFVDKHGFSALADGTQSITLSSSSAFNIDFPDITGNEKGYFDGTDYTFPVIPYNLNVKIFATVRLTVTIVGASSVSAYLRKVTTVYDLQTISSSGTYTMYFELPTHSLGDVLTKFNLSVIRSASDAHVVDVVSGIMYTEISQIPVGKVAISPLVLPELNCKSFIKDYLIRHGAMVKLGGTGGATITLKNISTVIRRKEKVLDWTDKRDHSFQDKIKFGINEFAQDTEFADSESESAIGGSYSMLVDNKNLDSYKRVYTSPNIAMNNRTYRGAQIVHIPLWDESSESILDVSSEMKPGLRLLYKRSSRSDDPTIYYEGLSTANYFIGVYEDFVTQDQIASWRTFIETFYPELRDILSESRLITRRYNLTPKDVSDVEPDTIIYDNGSYFLVDTIDKFVAGLKTSVLLLKID